jgi:hypothetical protein
MSRKVMALKEQSSEVKITSKKKSPGQNSQSFDIPTQQVQLTSIIQRAKRDPHSLRPSEVLELQRMLGNQAVMRLLQADLTVGQPGDQYEQEADRVADQIASSLNSPTVQMMAPEEEEEVQTKSLLERIARGDTSVEAFNALNRTLVDEEGKASDELRIIERPELDRRPAASLRMDKGPVLRISKLDSSSVQEQVVSPLLAQRIEQRKGQCNPLPTSMQSIMSQQLGHDFSNVRVKTDTEAADLSQQLGARAFTQGRDIWLGQGESINDTRLIAHELTHVVQQGAAPSIEHKREPSLDRSNPASSVLSYLRGMMRGEKQDSRVYQEKITQFNRENPQDRLAFLQRQILGSTTDISHGANPNSVRLGMCGGGGGGESAAPVAAPPTFPTVQEMQQDADVETERAADWAAGEGDYAERSGWIMWNSDTEAYSVVGKATGDWESCTPTAKPADTPPSYHVGHYHQHPPLPPAEAPDTARYPVAPSGADRRFAASKDSPGMVRDYTDTTRTTVCDYFYGPTRRS